MSRRCDICGKTGVFGRTITRSGSPKYKGGIGLHTGGITNRRFNPNVQKIRVLIDGEVKRVRVCARCLKAGKVQRPPVRPTQIRRSEEKEAARLAREAELARVEAETEAAVEAERIDAEKEEAAEEAAWAAQQAEREKKRVGRRRGEGESYADMATEPLPPGGSGRAVEKKPAEAAPEKTEPPTAPDAPK